MNHGWGNNGGQQQGQGAPSQRGNTGGQQSNRGGNNGQYIPTQNHNDGNRGGQQRFAVNTYNGHNAGGHF